MANRLTLQEFIHKYEGVPVDFDKVYGAQCVDLVRQYFKEVWGFDRQPEGVVGASDFYYKHESRPIQNSLCDCVVYRKGRTPPSGAVVIFKGSPSNQYGHIAICISADEDVIVVFEQDGSYNDKAVAAGKPQKGAYIGRWGYERLSGWLVPKEMKDD